MKVEGKLTAETLTNPAKLQAEAWWKVDTFKTADRELLELVALLDCRGRQNQKVQKLIRQVNEQMIYKQRLKRIRQGCTI